jgi:putative DNA-invertase from lambdoid prophage Rac
MQKAVRDAMLAFMAALGKAQAEATKIAQRAGIEHVKQNGKFLGRKPQYTRAQVDLILEMLAKGTSITEIACAVDCGPRFVSNALKSAVTFTTSKKGLRGKG